LGKDAPGLSASTVVRLKEVWQQEFAAWNKRSLADKRYAYFWVNGVHVAGQRRGDTTRRERKRRRRRSAVEPKIGRHKSDHRMNRCYLTELEGDAINAMPAAPGSNLLKLLRRRAAALNRWLRITVDTASIILEMAPCFAVPASVILFRA